MRVTDLVGWEALSVEILGGKFKLFPPPSHIWISLMLYELALDCPVAWPEHPVYPIDTPCSNVGASTSQVSLDAFLQPQPSPQKPTSTLRELILDTLFGTDNVPPRERIAAFIRRVARRASLESHSFRDALEPVQELEEKFRSIYKALDALKDQCAPAAVLEALADNTTLDNEECVRVQQAHAAFLRWREGQKIKMSLRDWNSALEVLAHEIQAVLLLHLIKLEGIDVTQDLQEALEFITDRLAIRQAMLGLSLDLTKDSAEGNAHDDIQQFLLSVEKHFDMKPDFWASHHAKLFPDSLFSDSDEPDTPPSSAGHEPEAHSASDGEDSQPLAAQPKKRATLHPTPDLIRLAAKAQGLRAQQEQEASLRLPASPTMAKLLGGDYARGSRESSASTTVSSRRGTLKRSSSMPMGQLNAKQRSMSREVSMRQRTASVEPQAHSQQQQQQQPTAAIQANGKKPRLNKRKQMSPKKHTKDASNAHQSLLVHSKTPSKLKIRPKAQRAQSFADLGRLFRPGSALLAPPSSDLDFPDMFDEPEPDEIDHVLANATPMSHRSASAPKAVFGHLIDDSDDELGDTPGRS